MRRFKGFQKGVNLGGWISQYYRRDEEYFNTFITNDIYADVSRAAILGSMEATTAVARMVALSAIAAVVTTFLMGALSDKLKNRKLFISVGYLFWGAVTAVFGFITKENIATLFHLSDEATILGTTVWFVILMDIVMTFMGSTSNDAAFQAWVTDVTVPRQRPLVETVLSVVGTVSSFAVTGVGSFAQAGKISYKVFFIGLGILVSVCGVVGLFLIKDPPKTAAIQTSGNYLSDLVYGFLPSVIKENAKLYLAENPDVMNEVIHKVRVQYGLDPDDTAAAEETSAPDVPESGFAAGAADMETASSPDKDI